jgi:hypothetical protein
MHCGNYTRITHFKNLAANLKKWPIYKMWIPCLRRIFRGAPGKGSLPDQYHQNVIRGFIADIQLIANCEFFFFTPNIPWHIKQNWGSELTTAPTSIANYRN